MITSLSNPLVKQARLLRQRKFRSETGQFLVEGLQPVGAALEAGWSLAALLFAPDLLSSEYAKDLVRRAPAAGVRTESVSRQVFDALADKENPQGLLAVVQKKSFALDDVNLSTVAVALHAPQDPGNVGAILRTLDAVGGQALFLLDGGVDPFHPTTVRASMGALFWVAMVATSWAGFSAWCRDRGIQILGTSANGTTDFRSAVPRKPYVMILGNEQKGLPTSIRAACDLLVRIPMQGHASSLNLSAAAAVLLYELSVK